MTGLLAVIPVISTQYADVCLDSILMDNSAAGLDPRDILIVDNTRHGLGQYKGLTIYRDPDNHNLGVARSWNVGAQHVLDNQLDYLLIISAAMQFGPIKETTWATEMARYWGADLIEAFGHSWHLIAIHRRCFETVGLFDGNFYPAYFEQTDWCHRLQLVGMEDGWPRAWVNALSQGVALHLPLLDCPAPPLLAYYREKWAGDKGAETYSLPWGDKPLDYWPKTTIPELATRYGLKVWW